MQRTTIAVERWESRTEWLLAGIALAFLASYSVEVLVQPAGPGNRAVELVATIAWIAFSVDYAVRLYLTPNRFRWFFRHLLDLAIVVLPMLGPLRLIRLLILVKALQKALGDVIRGQVALYTAAGATLLVYVAALAALQVERYAPDAQITSFGESIWWAIATITTVGYGDTYPVTTTGRAIAVVLMLGGISLLGTVTATIASWIVQRVSDDDADQQQITADLLVDLRNEVHDLREELAQRQPNSGSG
ncbi:MAG: ion channel [Rhodococcus sp. (in: high G+C Gram-positive bacteria)]